MPHPYTKRNPRGAGRKPLVEGEPTVYLTVRIPASLRDRLDAVAGDEPGARSDFARDVLERAVLVAERKRQRK